MLIKKTTLVTVVAGLALAAPASAATVGVERGDASDSLAYAADPGETNDVTVAHLDSRTIRVTDPGATIAPGEGCVAVDAHSADCTAFGEFLTYAIVTTGDLDDTIRSAGDAPSVTAPALLAYGGEGNDRLFGGEAADELDGGPGADELRGGEGADTLFDGDPAGALSRDVLDGGGNTDTADYSGRSSGVIFDLMAPITGQGEEADQLTDVENVYGGEAADDLRGDDEINELWGGAGGDRLVGRGGGDYLRGGTGPDRYSCGAGDDIAFADQRGDFVAPDCELVGFEHPDVTFSFQPTPDEVRRGALGFTLGCPNYIAIDRAPRCYGTLTLRAGRRLLGRGTIARGVHREVDVKLTRAGRRLAARRDGVKASVTASFRATKRDLRATLAYSTRLKSHK